MKLNRMCVFSLILLFPAAALADFQVQKTTQVTGGSLLSMMKMMGRFSSQARQIGQPIVSTVYVQGNKMASVSSDSIEIIDLDKDTITNVNLEKHTYTVMTFEQMRQRMEAAMAKAKQEQAKAKQGPSEQPSNNVDMKFNVNVRNTGATKQLSGLDTHEAILTMQMEGVDKTSGQKGGFDITNDMWLAPEVPGYEELRDFQTKLAVKMGSLYTGSGMSSAMMAMQPGMAQGMSEMAKEMSKLKGIPVQEITRMGTTANGEPLPAASEAPLPPTSSGPSVGDVVTDAATQTAVNQATSKAAEHGIMGLGGLSGLGGFGGFHKKKKKEAPPPAAPATPAAAQASAAVLMETRTDLTSFSSAPIDPAKFSVPAGFTQVQPKGR